MTLLTIIQDAAIRCGIKASPSDVTQAFTSSDADIQQLVAFSRDTGVDCYERHDWRNLKIQGQITGDGSSTQFTLPADFQRIETSDKYPFGRFVSATTPAIPISGPVSDQFLQELKAYPGTTAYPVWRLIGGAVEVWPALASTEVLEFWYNSRNWILNANGSTRQVTWAADTDTSLINEDTIMKGTVWRYKASKGLDYAEAFRDYETSLERNAGQDGAGRTVQLSGNRSYPLDNYYPYTITP